MFNFENQTQTIMKILNCLIVNLQVKGQQMGREVIWAQVSTYVSTASLFQAAGSTDRCQRT